MKKPYYKEGVDIQNAIQKAKQHLENECFVYLTSDSAGCGKKSLANHLICEELNIPFDRTVWLDCGQSHDFNNLQYDAIILFNIEKISPEDLKIITGIIETKNKYILFLSTGTLIFNGHPIISSLCAKTVVRLPSIKERSDKYEILELFLGHFFRVTKEKGILIIDPEVKVWINNEFDWSKENMTLAVLEDLAAYAIIRGVKWKEGEHGKRITEKSFLTIDKSKAFFNLIKNFADGYRKELYRM